MISFIVALYSDKDVKARTSSLCLCVTISDQKSADKKKSVMALIGQGQIPLLMFIKVLAGKI